MIIARYVIPFLFSFVLTFVLTFLAVKFFPRFGLVDNPKKYGLKRDPIAYYGGVVMFIGFVISVLLFVPLSLSVSALFVALFLIVFVAFLDDMFGLNPWLRLFVQVVGALSLSFAGIGIESISNPFGDPFLLNSVVWSFSIDHIYIISLFGALFTVFWILFITNSMNFLDGLNGLPSGVSVIAGLSLFLISVRPDLHFESYSQVSVATMSIILVGVVLAFWFFDFYPASILMGDSGSMFLGFLIASLAIFSGGKVATAFLVLGVPILDAFWVILRRILKGKSPMKGDFTHLHHRLLFLGFSERRILVLVYFFTALFGIVAVFFDGIYKVLAILALFLIMAFIEVGVVFFGKNGEG